MTRIITNRKLRQFFEKEQFGGSSELYRKHFAAVKKKYPHIGELSEHLTESGSSEDSNSKKLADDIADEVANRVVQQLSQAVTRLVMMAAFVYFAVVTLKWLIDGGWLTVLQVVAFIFGLFSGRQ